MREVYAGIGGGVSLADLTNSAIFPNNPTAVEVLTNGFEAPTDVDDSYGQRLRGYIQAPRTGAYTFWIASDDAGGLFLSTDENPANKRSIAAVAAWTASREWTKEPGQKSVPITLEAGRRYYIEALMKEGGGGDNLAVRWQLPDGTLEEPIPASRLYAEINPPQVATSPADATVAEGDFARFTVVAANLSPVSYQWLRNGTAIAGARFAQLTNGPVTQADSGSTFSCVLSNDFGTVTSGSARLTVRADTTGPSLLNVLAPGAPSTIRVLFSEPVEVASATRASNYSIDGGLQVSGVLVDPDGQAVTLTVTPMTLGRTYTVVVSNVRDRATSPNTITPGSQRSFSYSFTPADISLLKPRSERLGPSSRRTGMVFSEIMYHPAERVDGRSVEFVELYNTQSVPEDLSGWGLRGAVRFTFPPGTVLPPRSFLVVAGNPSDLQTVYNLTGVQGPYTRSLSNKGESLRLENQLGAVLLEVAWDDQEPWPLAADGTGHSLVLARPSYGEANAKAWAASAEVGGSPGRAEPAIQDPYRTILINEFLAHTDDPELDYIEFFNYSSAAVDLSGCILTDDPGINRFILPKGTVLPALGFAVFNQSQMGFSLHAGGETVLLYTPDRSRVIEALRFTGQANGVARGRFPDGAPGFRELSAKTPGAPNAGPLRRPVVINEIMAAPVAGATGEYVELFNRSTTPVDLSGWRLSGGASFTFPSQAVIPANGYVVVARDAAFLLTNYTQLSALNTFGNFKGSLSNQGERLRLTMPDEVASTNASGVLVTNTIHIIVDEATYAIGGRWPRWAGGGGSSLELIDPAADRDSPFQWADSADARASTPWTTVEFKGTVDNSNNGNGGANAVNILMHGSGECLVDNVEVLNPSGVNLVPNGTFEAGADGWVLMGSHSTTSIEPGEGYNSARSLHVRADFRGDTGANKLRAKLSSVVPDNTVVTLRARVKYLRGHPEILLRLNGNGLEATGPLLLPPNPGTPGQPNSTRIANSGPSIIDTTHRPVLPTAGQSVTVSARISDPDGIASATLFYRIDPAPAFQSIPMIYRGAGIYTGTIPGQSAGSIAAFHIQSSDTRGASSFFPSDAPARECLVRFGETQPASTFGTYRIWMTKNTITRWTSREKLSNSPLDVTFAYNDERVIYNGGSLYSGSPWHSGGWSGPTSGLCDYIFYAPPDDPFLGVTDFVLASVGNLDSDDLCYREQLSFWMLSKLGCPFNHRRFINLYVNGLQRGRIFEDAQQPGGEIVSQWFPGDDRGNLHKIEDWFEFNDSATSFSNIDARLNRYTTTGGVLKMARYRWNFRQRAVKDSANDYQDLFDLVNAFNASNTTDAYTPTVENLVDVEEWARVFAVEHIAGNWDSYGYNRGKNMYLYKPQQGPWKLLAWDIDFVLGSGSDPSTASLFAYLTDDVALTRMYTHPPFRRAFYRALKQAVDTVIEPSIVNPVIDARHQSLVANGIPVGDRTALKSFLSQRRTYIQTQLNAASAPLSVTSNSGADFSSSSSLISLTGTAPFEAKRLAVNGVVYPITWTSVTAWKLQVPLSSGTNVLNIQSLDPANNPIPGQTTRIAVTYTGPSEPIHSRLVINEIMYHPAITNAGFVEIFNAATNATYDLSGFEVHGINYTFPAGTIIRPQTFILLAASSNAVRNAYGSSTPVFAEYKGSLDANGESLRLVLPGGGTNGTDLVISPVTYASAPPWPAAAAGQGASLQLIDPLQDTRRIANWAAALSANTTNFTTTNLAINLLPYTNLWRYNATGADPGPAWTSPGYSDASWPSGRGLLYVEDAALPAPKSTPLTLGKTTYYFRTSFNFTGDPATAKLALSLIVDDGAVVYLNGSEVHRIGMPDGAPTSATTLASRTVGDAAIEGPFNLPVGALVAGVNTLAVEVHQASSSSTDVVFGLSLDATIPSLVPVVQAGGIPATPGSPNSVRTSLPAFPGLWINEVQPQNLAGIQDASGKREPWIELLNTGPTSVLLAGLFLSDNTSQPTRWPFPTDATLAPGEFRVVFADGDTNQTTAREWHANFRPSPTNGIVLLSRLQGGTPAVLDALAYSHLAAGRTVGAMPDGQPETRRELLTPTPGAPNTDRSVLPPVFINEWMADNSRTLANPLTGQFDDWFELYNAGSDPVELGGFFLANSSTNRTQFAIPASTTIPSHGFLLVWADGQPARNTEGAPLHVNFKLSLTGETVGLFAPDGQTVDLVTFGLQSPDVSQGRKPDGSATLASLDRPTPGSENVPVAGVNHVPSLQPIQDARVDIGGTLSVTCLATDPDSPTQSLRFTLDPGAPPGVALDAISGRLTWTPSAGQGGFNYPITVRVTDSGSPPLSAVVTFTVAVIPANRAPSISPIGTLAAIAGVPFAYTLTASDPDSPPQRLRFTLEGAVPTGLTVDLANGVIRWTPEVSQIGDHSLSIRVSDDAVPPLSSAIPVTISVIADTGGIRIGSITASASGVIGLRWTSQPGVFYQIEYLRDLNTLRWSPLQSVMATEAATTWEDHPAPGTPSRYYRVQAQP